MFPNNNCADCDGCTPVQTTVTPVPCNGNQCVELYHTNCIVYDGTTTTCGTVVFTANERLTTIITKLITAVCAPSRATGSFTSADGKTVTVVNGIITTII